jgi:hypothetical protein
MGFFLLLCFASIGILLAAGVAAARALLWLVFLPFKLLFGILLFPIWLVKTAFKIVGFAIVLPIAAVAGGIAILGLLLAAALAVLVPLAPILIVGGLLYLVVRSFSRRPMPVA